MTSALGTQAKFACDFKLATRLTASKLSLVSTRYRGIADVGGGILNGSKGSFTLIRSPVLSGGSRIHSGRCRMSGRCVSFSSRSVESRQCRRPANSSRSASPPKLLVSGHCRAQVVIATGASESRA